MAAHQHHSGSPHSLQSNSPKATASGKGRTNHVLLPVAAPAPPISPPSAAATYASSADVQDVQPAEGDMEDVSLTDSPTVSRSTGYGRMA